MGMIVTHLVVASTSSGDCETLHNRRKIMVDFLAQGFFALTAPLHVCMQNLSWATLHALDKRQMLADNVVRVCLALQVMREFCAEVGLSSMACHDADDGMISCFSCSWPPSCYQNHCAQPSAAGADHMQLLRRAAGRWGGIAIACPRILCRSGINLCCCHCCDISKCLSPGKKGITEHM